MVDTLDKPSKITKIVMQSEIKTIEVLVDKLNRYLAVYNHSLDPKLREKALSITQRFERDDDWLKKHIKQKQLQLLDQCSLQMKSLLVDFEKTFGGICVETAFDHMDVEFQEIKSKLLE